MSVNLDTALRLEILRLSEKYHVPSNVLENFTQSVIFHIKPPKELTINQLKGQVYRYFRVSTTDELKKSDGFQMATDGMGKLNFKPKETWKKLYREFVGVLPNEEWEIGYGCINGINIFKYNLPWRVFNLDPKTSSIDDIKSSYRELSKVYHSDIPSTGDAKIFERINLFYRTLVSTP